MEQKDHWDRIYSTKRPDALSWYQEHAEYSIRLIRDTGVPLSAAIIDVGGGTSTLVDDLLREGYTNLTVLDLSAAALETARKRLGPDATRVRWIEGSVIEAPFPNRAYDVWHDRAVFHFLTSPEDREGYVQAVLGAVKPGGHVIVATFGEEGPTECSGLPVKRYSAKELHAEFGEPFELLRHETEEHRTPFGSVQQFVYCYCLKRAP